MKSKTIGVLLLAFLMSFVMVGTQSPLQAASQEPTVEMKAKQGTEKEKKRNVRGMEINPSLKSVAPPSKGGPKTRGSWCRVHIDNRTQWPISVYMNRTYVGQVSAWGDAYADEPGQRTDLYGEVDFTDGTWKSWTFDPVDLGGYSTYTYRLWP